MKSKSYNLFLFVLLLCLLINTISIGNTFKSTQVDINARSAGIAGSFVAIKNDPNAIFYNPAALSTIVKTNISASYLNYFMDVNVGSICYAGNIVGLGNIAFGVNYFDYGTFEKIDEKLTKQGEFNASEIEFILGIVFNYNENIYYGVNVKYLHSSLAYYSSNALALDFGIMYDIPDKNLTFGLSLLSVGTQIKKYTDEKESLPADLKVGISFKPQHMPALLSLNFHRLNQADSSFVNKFARFTLGAEFFIDDNITLRAGYNNQKHKDLKIGNSSGSAGLTFGVGINWNYYNFDYALNSYGAVGSFHHFSIGIKY